MTKPLTELFEKAVQFSEEESWRRCGYDSEKEPHVKFIIGGARGENHSRKPIDLATKKLIEALEFYARGLSDLEPKPEKAHLYTEDFDMNSIEWRQRSMSDYWSGKIARQALAEFRASLEDVE